MKLSSFTRSVRTIATAAVMAGILLSTTAACAHDVTVYRGVDATASTGNAKLGPSQFRFNPGLSTFDSVGTAPKPCFYRFTITDVPNQPPQVNDKGNVSGLVGYTATFDDDPPGHWDIHHPSSENATEAGTAVSKYAQENRGNVVNGTLTNCK